METLNNYTALKTERLILRRLVESDWEMIQYLRSDPDINKFVKRATAETKEKALEFIAKITDGIQTHKLYYWCISENNNPLMIGSICLCNISKNRKTAELEYDLNPQFHGKGIMQEAMQSVLEFGFNQLKLNVIEAFTNKENIPSKNLLIRNLFRLNKNRKDEGNVDNLIFEINRHHLPSNNEKNNNKFQGKP